MASNSRLDQADGLRNLVGVSSMQAIAFVSAIPTSKKNALLHNLATALVNKGSDVNLLDATLTTQGISSLSNQVIAHYLTDLTEESTHITQVFFEQSKGITISKLAKSPINNLQDNSVELERLSNLMMNSKPEIDFCLIDIDLQNDNPFLLPNMTTADIVILTSNTPDSIKFAYLQIKQLNAQLGRRPYHLLVVDASVVQAKQIHQNMTLAAKKFLAVSIIPLGVIPHDDFLTRATQLGKTVIDAFPTAVSTQAIKTIASRLVDKTKNLQKSN